MSRVSWYSWALLIGSACLPSAGSSWPDPTLDLAFVYRISADGTRSIERVSTRPGSAYTVALVADQQVYLLGATSAVLEASYPSFSSADSLADARLILGAIDDDEELCLRYGALDPIQNRLQVPLRRDATVAHLSVWRFDRTSGAWQTAEELPDAEQFQLEYTPGSCLPGQALTREPFSAAPLPRGLGVD